MPSCAAIVRLRWCKVTRSAPEPSWWAWRNSHWAQRASASCAKRLTASSVCWYELQARSRTRSCTAWGKVATARTSSERPTRRTCTVVSATRSATLGWPSKAGATSSQHGPSTVPSWWRSSSPSRTPSSTRPLSRCSTEVARSLRAHNNEPAGNTSAGVRGSRKDCGSMAGTVPVRRRCSFETHQNAPTLGLATSSARVGPARARRKSSARRAASLQCALLLRAPFSAP